MENERLWNVWIQLPTLGDREYVIHATGDQVQELREYLANHEYVNDFDIGEENAEFSVEDVKEELADWSADELDL